MEEDLDEADLAHVKSERKKATKLYNALTAAFGAKSGLYATEPFAGTAVPIPFREVELEDGIYATLELEDGPTLKDGIYACLAPLVPGGGGSSSTAPRRPYKAPVFVTEVEDAMDAPDELEKNVRVMYDVVQGSGPNPEPLSQPDAHVMLGVALPPSRFRPTHSHLPL